MRTAYFDCFAGASGDMILGALIDAGLDIGILKKELKKLDLSGYTVKAEKSVKKGISGTRLDVRVKDARHHRGLNDIIAIIDGSGLRETVKENSKRIFTRLGEAEAKIHDKTVDEIHFHEVGAVDSIIDIVGAVIGLEILNITKVCTSRIHVGTGTLQCAHGTLPVPAPATAELLKNTPVYSTGIPCELVTPTGAAILTTLSECYGALPAMTIETTGYGLGSRDLKIPNLLRIIIGRETESPEQDTVQLIETNIDDMNPQFYEHVMEILFAAGARDVYMTPVIMKKNRPGILLSVIASVQDTDKLTDIILRETTTLGVRISQIVKRNILPREIRTVKTSWGDARVKVRNHGGETVVSPEYDDCKRLAKENQVPIRTVYDAVKKAAG